MDPGARRTEEEAMSAAAVIPPEAVTAAMRAVADHHCLEDDDARRIALTALEAAVPLIVDAVKAWLDQHARTEEHGRHG
jgi:hypothetical protein